MLQIPNREKLRSMSRTDIQKLCKDNSVKANMRTDEMINALCDLVNGNEVPRPQRLISEGVQPAPISRKSTTEEITDNKPSERVAAKKLAFQPSDADTDAGGTLNASTPVPLPTVNTRRRAKDLQTHLGKGRPVAAGGTGARKITKVTSRGRSGKTRASATLHEPAIIEQDESASQPGPSTVVTLVKEGSHSQPPTPAPPLPSPSFPTVQLNALNARIQDLESPNLATRLQQLEQTVTQLPSVTSFKQLQDLIMGLTESHSRMETQMKDLIVENKVLKIKVNELETRVQDQNGSCKSLIVHPSPQSCEREIEGLERDKNAAPTIPPCDVIVTPITRRRLNDELPDPSPCQSTLGKRARRDSLDTSVDGILAPFDPVRDAIERITRPLRKRQRLDNNEDTTPCIPLTSTPKQTTMRPGMGRPEESIVAQADMSIYLNLDDDYGSSAFTSKEPEDTDSQTFNQLVAMKSPCNPNFFPNGPVFNANGAMTDLPFPLVPPRTPTTSIDPAPLTTPRLGEPWIPDIITPNYPKQRLREASGSDKFVPYSPSGRRPSSGNSRRTGLTPRMLSRSLKSPAPMPTVPESPEAGDPEDSPPALRTMYGTELYAGDTRFGDYGREMGKDAWGKWV